MLFNDLDVKLVAEYSSSFLSKLNKEIYIECKEYRYLLCSSLYLCSLLVVIACRTDNKRCTCRKAVIEKAVEKSRI